MDHLKPVQWSDALSVGVLVFLWAAVHFLLAARTYRRDLHQAEPA